MFISFESSELFISSKTYLYSRSLMYRHKRQESVGRFTIPTELEIYGAKFQNYCNIKMFN